MSFQSIARDKIKKEGFPEPVPVSEELVDSLSYRQGQILTSLADLAEGEQRLIKEINALAPTPSGVLVIGNALTVCEDEDDWKVITMGQREKLRKVRDKIKMILGGRSTRAWAVWVSSRGSVPIMG